MNGIDLTHLDCEYDGYVPSHIRNNNRFLLVEKLDPRIGPYVTENDEIGQNVDELKKIQASGHLKNQQQQTQEELEEPIEITSRYKCYQTSKSGRDHFCEYQLVCFNRDSSSYLYLDSRYVTTKSHEYMSSWFFFFTQESAPTFQFGCM